MKLASLKSNGPDGKLVLVSKDHSLCTEVSDIAPTMQFALDNWDACYDKLNERYQLLNNGNANNASHFKPEQCLAPLPRAWSWLDGSCYLNHGHLMQRAFNLDPIEGADIYPLVYQGSGISFRGAREPLYAAKEEHGIDFEGEFGVITGHVPVGASQEEAKQSIRLVVMLNDVSFRALAPREMKTGFGFVQAKGDTAFAPIAVTPDELGEHWQDSKVCAPLEIHRNNEWFGAPDGAKMFFGFDQLIAHIAVARSLPPGSVIGSGTVSDNTPNKGQACLSELRAKELVQFGEPKTPFLKVGETITMRALDKNGSSLFGDIIQNVELETSNV